MFRSWSEKMLLRRIQPEKSIWFRVSGIEITSPYASIATVEIENQTPFSIDILSAHVWAQVYTPIEAFGSLPAVKQLVSREKRSVSVNMIIPPDWITHQEECKLAFFGFRGVLVTGLTANLYIMNDIRLVHQETVNIQFHENMKLPQTV